MKPHEPVIIYNLFPLLAGTFSQWGPHLQRAKEMGFTWVFVNPIQQTGKSGSLYSIADYFSINPIFVDPAVGGPPADQVKGMLRTAEGLGLKVMIDLVINHCSIDSAVTRSHPEWFVREHDGRISHPFAFEDGKKVVWRDLAKFDHRNTSDQEGMFRFFMEIIRFLADLGFSGFRCDAAYQLPRRLWERIITETRRTHPDILFFAETLGSPADDTLKTARAGFDFIFNSSKWWDFHSSWLMMQYNLTRDIAPSISFPESHDTIRLCQELNGNLDGMKQRYLFASVFSAGVMMPVGFEFGFRKKPHVVSTRPSDWEETGVDLRDFIKTANDVKAAHKIFMEEAPTEVLHADNPNILLLWKGSHAAGQEALLILNKDNWNRQYFHADCLHRFVQSGEPFIDVSPEYRLDFIPEPFSYELRPGQGILLVTREPATADEQ